jgi:hypothetical protein
LANNKTPSTPTRVDGLPAFSLVFDYKTKKGLPIRNKTIGFISAKGFVILRFEAPNLIYYERDLPAFEQMVASIKVKK